MHLHLYCQLQVSLAEAETASAAAPFILHLLQLEPNSSCFSVPWDGSFRSNTKL